MAELDDTARFALKLAPAEALRWLVPEVEGELAFGRWLDTNMIAFPGEPRRRCDTVAELLSRGRTEPPWALVLEVEARPRATMPARLLEYLARVLRRKRHGPRNRDPYQVVAVLVYLSGRKKSFALKMRLPRSKLRLTWVVRVVSLPLRKAARTLQRIAQGELGRSILIWVPLMDGGGDPATVAEWVRLVRGEPNEERQAQYASLALVFAEWAGRLPAWKQALEGWNVWESQLIKEWKQKVLADLQRQVREQFLSEGMREGMREGRLEEKRTVLLSVLRKRFQVEIPADLVQTIQQMTDLGTLSRWFDAALDAPSLEAFRSLLQAPPPPEAKQD